MPLLALLLSVLLQDAPPASPGAPQATPAAAPKDSPAAPAAPAAQEAAKEAAAAPAPAPVDPRQVWIFVDRWKEFGGTVVGETEQDITVFDGHETRSFTKSKIADIVEIVHPKPGQRGLIQLRDGTIVRGEIIRDSLDEVEFKVDSVRGKLPRTQVYRVVLELDFDTRYARIRSTIAPEEHGRRLALARWLVERDRMDLAVKELEALLRDADVEEARDMLRDIDARIKLAQSIEQSKRAKQAAAPGPAPAPAPAPGPAPGPAPAGTAPAPTPSTDVPVATEPVGADQQRRVPSTRDMLPKDLLTDADVNLIRVYEINFRDPPRVTVSPEGVRQLILRYGSSALVPATTQERNALYSKPAVDLARLLFDLKARDLYSYIEVEEDPESLAKFRTRVHNSWLIGNCATSRCHGGLDAGRFFLYTGNAKDQRIRYTNLMTLLSFKVDGKPMVSFEDPPNSLLVQYALPRHLARYPHPDIKGWKPVLSESTPQLMQDTLDWIRSMYQPRPDYPVNYIAPKLDAPDAPVPTPDGPDR